MFCKSQKVILKSGEIGIWNVLWVFLILIYSKRIYFKNGLYYCFKAFEYYIQNNYTL